MSEAQEPIIKIGTEFESSGHKGRVVGVEKEQVLVMMEGCGDKVFSCTFPDIERHCGV